MSEQSAPLGWPGQPPQPSFSGAPSAPVPGSAGAHPLLWARMPAELASPPAPRSPEEALAMMERSHAATIALIPEDADGDPDETTPLTRAWFDGVREACARTGRVPGVERMLFEWWIEDPPIEGLSQLPWLFGVWQGHWICWAGTTPWAAADLAAKSTYDAGQLAAGVQFGADPEHPPAHPWPPFGTAALAVPTTILVALSGKPAPANRVIPVTPIYVVPAPPPPPPPPPAPAPIPEPPPAPAAAADLDPVVAGAVAAEVLSADAPASPEGDLPVAEADGEPIDATDLDATADPIAVADPAGETEGAVGAEEHAEATTPEPEAEPAAPEAEAPDAAPDGPADVAAAAEGGPTPTEPAPVAEPVAEVAPVAPIEPVPAPNLPPAGWFPDPAGRHALRYWDGTDWTAHAADPGSDTIHDPI